MSNISPEVRKVVQKIKFPWGSRMKTREKHFMDPRSAIAQLAMSGTPHSQKLIQYNKSKGRAVLEDVKGKTFSDVCHTDKGRQWILKNQDKVIDDTATIISNLLQRGVRHNDVHRTNIIVQNANGKPKLKLIDYEDARQSSEGISLYPHYDLFFDTSRMLDVLTEQLFGWEKTKAKAEFKKKFMKKLEQKINSWA